MYKRRTPIDGRHIPKMVISRGSQWGERPGKGEDLEEVILIRIPEVISRLRGEMLELNSEKLHATTRTVKQTNTGWKAPRKTKRGNEKMTGGTEGKERDSVKDRTQDAAPMAGKAGKVKRRGENREKSWAEGREREEASEPRNVKGAGVGVETPRHKAKVKGKRGVIHADDKAVTAWAHSRSSTSLE